MKKKFLVALLGLAIIGGTLTACTEEVNYIPESIVPFTVKSSK